MKQKFTSFKEYFYTVKEALKYSFRIAPKESFATCFLYIIYAVLPYGTAFLLGTLVNKLIVAIQSPESIKSGEIIWLFIAYAVIGGLPDLIASIRTYIEKSWRFKFQAEMEVIVLRKRIEVDIAHYENPQFQDLYQRAFQRSFWPFLEMADIQFDVMRGIIAIIAGSVLATAFRVEVCFIILLSCVPKFIAEYKYGFNIWSIWMKDTPEQRRFVDLRKYFIHRTSIVETKLIQSSKYLLNWVKKILIDFNNKQLGAEKSKMFNLILSEILALAGFVFASFLILQDVTTGKILVGSMVYLLSVLSNVRHSFSDTLANIGRQNDRHLIAKDMLTFFNTKSIITRSTKPIKLNLEKPPEIIFENVSFKYPNTDKWTIRNINIKISPQQKIGLVGNNGAGKTTLIKLICRIYDPTEGRILINGVDLKEIDIDEWWSCLGIMFQDYNNYDFPVKDSIAIGRSEKGLDMKKVLDSAEISQTHEFVKDWKDKYDQAIGVEFGGVEPSKGQRQKLAIAKTIYRNPFIMILDEPTASVDAESEAKIFDSLEKLPESMTAIFISHDFSTIKECDNIFVLENGSLVEEGDHKTLMKNKGLYAHLFNLQAKRFISGDTKQ